MRLTATLERLLCACCAICWLPVALPVLSLVVIAQGERPGPRRPTWYWSLWWWYGYHGLYRIDWFVKRRRR